MPPSKGTAVATAPLAPPSPGVVTPHAESPGTASIVVGNRVINNALKICGIDARPRWITDSVYDAFRADLAVCNYELVPRLVTWHRADAGYFLMGLAHKRDPFMCLQDPFLVLEDHQRNLQTTIHAIINVRVCESAESERMPPVAWIAFAQQQGLKIDEDVVCEVAARCVGSARIPARQLHMLHKTLGAALALAELDGGVPISRIVDELNAKGAGIDRKRVTPHIRAALGSLNSLVV